jgi:hypothetical protein
VWQTESLQSHQSIPVNYFEVRETERKGLGLFARLPIGQYRPGGSGRVDDEWGIEVCGELVSAAEGMEREMQYQKQGHGKPDMDALKLRTRAGLRAIGLLNNRCCCLFALLFSWILCPQVVRRVRSRFDDRHNASRQLVPLRQQQLRTKFPALSSQQRTQMHALSQEDDQTSVTSAEHIALAPRANVHRARNSLQTASCIVAAGDEITIDYGLTLERMPRGVMLCHCGAMACKRCLI